MEEVVGLFSTAFEQACALKVVDGFVVNCLTRELMSAEVTAVLEKLERLSKAVLSGHGGQFKGQWKEWRRERRV
jgi:hypothetical protein